MPAGVLVEPGIAVVLLYIPFFKKIFLILNNVVRALVTHARH